VGMSSVVQRKRDRYSYDELEPCWQRLTQLADQYAHIDAKRRNLVQSLVLDLSSDMNECAGLIYALDFARRPLAVPASKGLEKTFGGAKEVPFSAVFERGRELGGLLGLLAQGQGDPRLQLDPATVATERTALQTLVSDF